MLKRRLFLAILLALLMIGCAQKGKGLSPEEQKYYQELNQAQEQLELVHSFVDSSKISKARYVMKLDEVRPVTQRVLAKYQSSPLAERESYRALLRAYESYLVARKMWEEDKGMALVNERMAEGALWLKKADTFLKQEKKGLEPGEEK
ncbi:hypothetical protein COW36_04095 [bacterium (Candidatus Blackallbacteria) CG17_big_fil_post_rev_8_21_14_2_50_48_46]|uniref:Lipoprotein n=1 Tax=bacterium (Candidatus Blackallbacteria) CG17_big_fil_post_rev_8_21_14_2_50_48_46 TaxID=2014261 RepID=A0A2M7G8P8_9BACT|nr:MAG: hypothetical protein COW64_04850 [bacterium (Candidatus Blackallbacteria) CG18_big_fil_WC_8_21_14_2_50_49_26]PIW18479.1 MAG: hypothetical protein COW36_04095 [bacterium (Candidatus Blackallbacteria) CG17_big_fil_post_rev_8_21_14_2_50_48_46]PIW46536.1 MAG: hypothetical protein COW20_16585 [bacterium (Candidatus Blackallbacteria) CG13_big_fil_rev_8_21_14_2_50_49_14]